MSDQTQNRAKDVESSHALTRILKLTYHEECQQVRYQTETIEEVYEPFLIQQGFIMRTPRGREVTEAAYKHLGKVKEPTQGGLF